MKKTTFKDNICTNLDFTNQKVFYPLMHKNKVIFITS